MTLLKMQTSPRRSQLARLSRNVDENVKAAATLCHHRPGETYWGKKCHKKDSHWIFKVSNLMFPSVAWSRRAVRKPSSRSYQSIHGHKKSSHTMGASAVGGIKRENGKLYPVLIKPSGQNTSSHGCFFLWQVFWHFLARLLPTLVDTILLHIKSKLQGSYKIYDGTKRCAADIIILKYFTFFSV